jgi:hypothetical protein
VVEVLVAGVLLHLILVILLELLELQILVGEEDRELHLQVLVVPVSSSSPTHHKYLKTQ